ncbi:sensor domain-containing diguanylate cyclase [Pseudoxanthomonas sacheonensis]|uniref:diguanylate cyclase n=1 Tax=Pseudoxanthomonas sacheonensis TaxID=443615 RepID=A0ABU1RW24_9GAMM|nr:diguanylate cyclase [Pseudoxanthomonas sacheonensis]MDR6842977.1 diguanylate cyclase (GGDEF)-like protein [Pseudoxanthomonas sacheonensis]
MRYLPRGNPRWRMQGSGLRLLAWGLLVLSATVAWEGIARAAQTSAAPALEVPVSLQLLDAQPRAHLSVDGDGVVLPPEGSPARFRLSFDLPSRNPDGSPWQLRFNRIELKELQLQAPGWHPPAQDFFRPQPHDGLLPMAFSQTLPAHWRGPVSVDVTASTELARTLRPQVVRMALGAEQDKRSLAVAIALYACLLVLAIVAVSLCLGARELAFLSFLAFVSASLLLMLVVNGHAYTVPFLAWLKPLGGQGTNIAMLLVSASGICTARDFAGRRPDNLWLRWTPVAGASAMVALAAAGLCGFAFAPETMQILVIIGWAAAAVLAMLAFFSAILRKAWLGWPLLTALIMLGISCTLFELSVRGMADPFWGRFGYQIGLVLVAVVLVVALIGRIADFRLKHEQERMARKASEQRLRQQQAYTDLADLLRKRLQDVASKDLEWYAVQMAMESLLPWLQLNSATIILSRPGYDQTRITEPVTHTSRLSALIDVNDATLRAVAQRKLPMAELIMNPVPGSTRARAASMAYAAVPLTTGKGDVGVALLERVGPQAFSAEELALVDQFGQLVLQQTAEARETQKLRRSAELDALTGMLNRNAIDLALSHAFIEAHKNDKTLAVLFIDVDGFKLVNDTYGHACGDQCLRHLADVLSRALRPGDLLGRYGGEEFLVLLPTPGDDQAREIGERIRLQIEESAVEWQDQKVKLTVSVGVATRLVHEQTPTQALERADRALYSAKHEGRNRVVLAARKP